jgi:hypothetical protein
MTRPLKALLVVATLLAATLTGAAATADLADHSHVTAGDRWCC